MKKTTLLSLAMLPLVAVGCADSSADEPEAEQEQTQTQTQTAQTAAPPSAAGVDQAHTVHIKIDNKNAFYNAGMYRMALCMKTTPATTIAKIENSGYQDKPDVTHLVIEKADGTWDSRVVNIWPNKPYRSMDSAECPGGQALYVNVAKEADVGHLQNLDLASFFTTTIAKDNISCSGGVGFKMTKDIAVSVKGFEVVGGRLQRPELSLTVEGDIPAGANASCSVSWSKPGVFMAGLIPVVYEVEFGLGLAATSKTASHVVATFGTSGGKVTATAPTFTITPSVALGVKFYGVVGGSVSAEFPFTVTPKPGKACSPRVTMDVAMKAGVSASIPGVGDFIPSKSFGYEASGNVLGPFVLRECQ